MSADREKIMLEDILRNLEKNMAKQWETAQREIADFQRVGGLAHAIQLDELVEFNKKIVTDIQEISNSIKALLGGPDIGPGRTDVALEKVTKSVSRAMSDLTEYTKNLRNQDIGPELKFFSYKVIYGFCRPIRDFCASLINWCKSASNEASVRIKGHLADNNEALAQRFSKTAKTLDSKLATFQVTLTTLEAQQAAHDARARAKTVPPQEIRQRDIDSTRRREEEKKQDEAQKQADKAARQAQREKDRDQSRKRPKKGQE